MGTAKTGHRRNVRCMQQNAYNKSNQKRSEETSRNGYKYVGYYAGVQKSIDNWLQNRSDGDYLQLIRKPIQHLHDALIQAHKNSTN